MSLNPPAPPRVPTTPPPLPEGFWDRLKQPRVWVPIVAILGFILLVVGTWFFTRSWLIALIVGLVVVLVVLIVVLLRIVFYREREEHLSAGIDDGDAAAGAQAAQAQQMLLSDLDGSFRRALSDLKASRVGDVYTLPWYLVLGESGGGKSDLVRHSGLDLPAEYAHTRPSGPTRDCDFWLTNQAIMLDAAGRYLDSDDPAVGREWLRLLALLKKHRSRFPLEGVVVALPFPSLFGPGPEQLIARAQRLRRRFNELTTVLRVDIPIYVVVTKADRMEGFVEFAGNLPPDRWNEALGWTNNRRRFADAGEIASKGLAGVRERLEALVPEFLLREPDPLRRRRLFLFPEEFGEACQALSGFLRGAFSRSAYDEVPFLRGVYFASAGREGTTLSPVLHRLGHAWAQAQPTASAALQQGLFLRDLFHEIVVGDRNLGIPRRWMGRRMRRAAVWSLAVLSLVALALLGTSFVTNVRAERRIAREARATIEGASSLAALDRLRLEASNGEPQRIPLDGLGLGGNLERARSRGRETFNWAFGREFESPTKSRLLGKIRAYDTDSFEALATATLDVAWLKSIADPELATRPELLPYAPIGRSEADEKAFREGYDAFVRWLPELQRERIYERERDAVLAAAPRLLSISQLEAWAKRSGPPPVRYADFGIEVPADVSPTQVSGAYTRRAWEELVNVLVGGIEKTGAASSRRVEEFRAEYVERYDARWRDLLMDTPTEPRPLAKVEDSPYLALLERIDEDTRAGLPRRGGPAAWVTMLREVRREEAVEEEKELPPWQRYKVGLAQVEADALAGVERGKEALAVSRKMDDADATSFGRTIALIRRIVPARPDVQASAKLREVLALPVLDGASAVFESTADELDKQWVARIAQPHAGSLDAQQLGQLYAPSTGALAKFMASGMDRFYADGRARPLLEDRGLPLGPAFLGWMASAEELRRALYPSSGGVPRITVRLAGVPTQVVSRGGLFVTRQDLRLACDDGVETFVYRQGTGSHSFAWTPRCQEVSLRIWARTPGAAEQELTPRREWRGPLAFPQFLQQGFAAGDRLQWRLDFGQVALQVVYQLRSGGAILQVAHRPPPMSLRN